MDAKIKKIIAREGLIFLPFIFISTFLLFQKIKIHNDMANWEKHGLTIPDPLYSQDVTNNSWLFYLIAPYALMIIIRFIIWAIRTLKQK